MTLVLNGTTGVSSVDGSAGTPAVQGTDTNTGVFFPAADTVAISTGGSERMRVDSSGRVGVGTDSPSYALDVSTTSSSITSAFRSSQSEAYLTLKDSGTTIGNVRLGSSSNAMLMLAGGSERMRIDSSGNVLLNTTDTTLYNNTTTGYGVCYRVNASLDVLSTSDNALILNRVGTDGGIAEFRKAGTIVGSISVTGSSTGYNTSSDYRLKEDIKPVENATARLLTLNPVNFAWKINGERVDGFLAHEAQEVVPEAVTGEKDAVDDEGNPMYQGIDQSKLVPLITAALQEALTKIDALEARIAALEAP